MELGEGKILDGRYRLMQCLESDGISSRWLAADLALDGAEVEISIRPEVVPSTPSGATQSKQPQAGAAPTAGQPGMAAQVVQLVNGQQIVPVIPQAMPIGAFPIAHPVMVPASPPGPPINRFPPPPKKVNDSKTEEELRREKERRDRRLAEIERRRRGGKTGKTSHRQPSRPSASTEPEDPTSKYRTEQAKNATSRAIWVIAGIVVAIGALVVWKSLDPGDGEAGQNRELAHAPVKKTFSQEELARFASFQGIEFGRIIEKTPAVGDTIAFGDTQNTVTGVSIDGKSFEVELASPVYKVFPKVRISLLDTPKGRRISALNFEKNGDAIKAAKASKVVSKIASLMENEYGIDMGDKETAINNVYFSRRYSDDLIDIRISTSVSPDSTSISFSIENRSIRMDEVVVRQ